MHPPVDGGFGVDPEAVFLRNDGQFPWGQAGCHRLDDGRAVLEASHASNPIPTGSQATQMASWGRFENINKFSTEFIFAIRICLVAGGGVLAGEWSWHRVYYFLFLVLGRGKLLY
eukprot:SAG31_NODE_304_length_18019_cov_10.386440_5_plen_115_part_00